MSMVYGPGNRLGTQSNVPTRTRKEDIYKHWRSVTRHYLFASGQIRQETLDFTARTIFIDNWSACYLYVPAAQRWAAPQATQQIFCIEGTNRIELVWSTPSGIVQPVDNLAEVTVQWIEQDLTNYNVLRG